jgi:hypothetical protein
MNEEKQKNVKHVFAFGVIIILLCSALTPVISGKYELNPNDKNESHSEKQMTIQNFDNNYAVIIGISDYKEQGNIFWDPDLPLPASNAIATKNVLCSHGWAEADQQENVHLILNSTATKDRILSELNWLKDKEGKVLFFFNGHGASIPDDNNDEPSFFDREDEAICPYDTDSKNFEETVIRDDELVDIIDEFKAEETVLIFCTCHSGGMIEKAINYNPVERLDSSNGAPRGLIKVHNDIVRFVNKFNRGITGELGGRNRVVMSSCGSAFLTREFPEDDDFYGYVGTPFVTYLIEGLRGYADAEGDKNSLVSAEEAFDYLKPRADALNTLAYLELLLKSDNIFLKLDTLMLAMCTLSVIYSAILTMFKFMPVRKILLWSSLFMMWKEWFDQYGILLPLAMIKDGDENVDIQLTQKSGTSYAVTSYAVGGQEFNEKEEYNTKKAEIEEAQDEIEKFITGQSRDIKRKRVNPLLANLLEKIPSFKLLSTLFPKLNALRMFRN